MLKIIDIDLLSKEDFLEKYNHTKIANDFLEYLIKEAKNISKKDELVLNIKISFNNDLDIKEMLINALNKEYINTINDHYYNNLYQLLLFFIGIFFLSLSTFFEDSILWKEILLIGGWVPIWEMIELELVNDVRGRKRKNIIKKLINSEININ